MICTDVVWHRHRQGAMATGRRGSPAEPTKYGISRFALSATSPGFSRFYHFRAGLTPRCRLGDPNGN